jgi:beta-phosphoglucomutase-like phosphatase (HAD superfamily)
VLHKFSGRVNKEILEDLFKQKFSSTKLNKLINEKENFYRKLFKHKAKPTLGLLKFLEELKRAKIPTVLATAGPPQNVEFILKETITNLYFLNFLFIKNNCNKLEPIKPAPPVIKIFFLFFMHIV